GGPGADNGAVNLDAITQQRFTPTDVVAHVNIAEVQHGDGSHDEKQAISFQDVTGGTYELTFGVQTTTPIQWDAPAKAVQDALVALPNISVDAKNEPNVGVTLDNGTYTVEFLNDMAHSAQDLMTSNVVVTQTTAGDATHNAVQHVHLQSVTSGSFSLDFTYDVHVLNLTSDPDRAGSLSAGPYYYVVT